MKMKFLLVSLAIFILATASFSQGNIRKVDFLNFTYEPSCAGEDTTKVKVKNGEFTSEKQEEGYVDRFYFRVFVIAYGDVTGDRVDDAVMLSVCNTGGTGNFTEGFVYSMKRGRPALVTRIPGGDRADGGLRDVKIEGGLIVLEYNDPEKTAGACCPEGIVTQKLRLTGKKLVEVGAPVKHDLFPTQRVSFARGASSATVNLTIPFNEGARLIVGARAGQTLTFSVNNDKIYFRLLGDTEVTTNATGFQAKLPSNGHYTIQLTNYEAKPMTVTVTIKIN
jgi:hypothetical protein